MAPLALPSFPEQFAVRVAQSSGAGLGRSRLCRQCFRQALHPATLNLPPNTLDDSSSSIFQKQGQRVRIVLTSGAEFEGVYGNGPEPTSCRLTSVQQKKLPTSAEITNATNRREQPAMTFQRKDIAEARVVPGNSSKNDSRSLNGTPMMSLNWPRPTCANDDSLSILGNRSSFRTDTAISNSRLGNERTLKAWVPDAGYEIDGSLEKSGSTGAWDQFAENERLFGLKTDYDENIYTTAIDKSHPQYKERLAAAERKAREIERSAPTTAHVAEERVMDFVGGDDQGGTEEDK